MRRQGRGRGRIAQGLLVLALAGAGGAAAAQSRSEAAPLPADVAAFMARRDRCDHFRGEDAPDAARAAEIAAQLAATCTGTDRALARLKRVHAGDPAVLRALATYDPQVE